jgi:hypothetical protein
MAST